MKNFLFSFVFLCVSMMGAAQLRINEVYVKPVNGDVNTEFFELTLDPTETSPENADSYALLAFYNTGSEQGAYLFDMPNRSIAPGSFLFAAAGPRLSRYQDSRQFSSTPHLNWNLAQTATSSASAKKFVYNGSTWDGGASLAGKNVNDVFSKMTPMDGFGDMVVLLFRKDGSTMDLVDGFIASEAEDRFEVPDYLQNLNDLSFPLLVGGASSTVKIEFDELDDFELGAVPMADFMSEDGYYFCSSWDQTIPGQYLTPNAINSSLEGDPLQAITNCGIDSNFVEVAEVSGQVSPYPITVSLYLDNNNDRVLDLNSGDTKYSQIVIKTQSRMYKMPKPAGNNNFILVLDGQGKCFDDIIPFFCEPEIVTPVTLKNFTAVRRGVNVVLDWQTASESNSRGFYIQRRKGAADNWETVAFVNSKAPGGNSTSDLAYTYNDAYNAAGETQYRLLQEDIDRKHHYSPVLSVRGLDQAGTATVYPNPSGSGTVNVVFDQAATLRNVIVTDMTGRMVQQWRGIRNNSLQINNLKAGLYNIMIQDVQSGTQAVERVAVTGNR
ncbi:T9SS type A sorting domain-containing protein [Paraflavisolibacter sp. H34]|uniref:T9SS type A sorting domain-containing protein n=1 Tax=Huijunlia imazamoxiresistens TaxID=3127457 RepID=UPI003019AEF7